MLLKHAICVLCVLGFLGASSGLASARDQDRGWKSAASGIQTCRQQSPQEAAKSRAIKRLIRYYR
jgi:hypothetical protein